MRVRERLLILADNERAITEQEPHSFPEFVDRAYHVGRAHAFKAAAELTRGQIRVAEVSRVHLVIDGVSFCGRHYDESDLHAPEAGPAVWAERRRCSECAMVLARDYGGMLGEDVAI